MRMKRNHYEYKKVGSVKKRRGEKKHHDKKLGISQPLQPFIKLSCGVLLINKASVVLQVLQLGTIRHIIHLKLVLLVLCSSMCNLTKEEF